MLKVWKHDYTQTYFAFSDVQLSGGALVFYQPTATKSKLPLSKIVMEPSMPEIMEIKEVRADCFEHNRNSRSQQVQICLYMAFNDCEGILHSMCCQVRTAPDSNTPKCKGWIQKPTVLISGKEWNFYSLLIFGKVEITAKHIMCDSDTNKY